MNTDTNIYICPTCHKKFAYKYIIGHYASCWKEDNPNHVSKEAPHSEDIETKEIEDGIFNFFKILREEEN